MGRVNVSPTWSLDLAAWIIQDGNYPDFELGQSAEFAVEFWPVEPFAIAIGGIRSAVPGAGSTYDVCAQVVAVDGGYWVIDMGLQVFEEAPPPDGVKVGSWIRGTIGLGVDPFFYFERLYRFEQMPPLIYTWTIDAIAMQTAPFVEAEPRMVAGDPDRLAWERIGKTDAWHDDGGNGSYLLTCSRLPVEPKRSSSTAT